MQRRKASIVVDCRMINSSGIGTYLKNILPGLIYSNQFSVIVMGVKTELGTFEWFSLVRFIPLSSKILTLREQVELPLKIPSCDLYWSPNLNGAMFVTRAKKRVTTIHDIYHLSHQKEYSFIFLCMMKCLIKASIFHSKFIITVSNFSGSELLKYTGCSKAKIKVIPEAVADSFASGFNYKKIGENYILCVGNVKPHKNLKIAIEAIKHFDIKLYIVGKRDGFITSDDSLSESVLEQADKIFFTGYVSDEELKNYYANAKVFLFPSLHEGFGLPVLEAMKFNIPIIASRSSSIPEVGGDVIEYFDPLDVKDLVKKLQSILMNEGGDFIEKYRLHLKKFSWEKAVNSHLDVFHEAIHS